MTESTTKTEVTIRRAPKFPVFLILGGALGAIVTLVLTMLQPADPNVGYPTLFGYFLLFGLPAGVVLGAIVAIVFDLISKRTAKRVTAELVSTSSTTEGD